MLLISVTLWCSLLLKILTCAVLNVDAHSLLPARFLRSLQVCAPQAVIVSNIVQCQLSWERTHSTLCDERLCAENLFKNVPLNINLLPGG